ncbi:MAG: HAD hydrolase-like protein [Spirochaetota bacterium]
MKKVILFDYDDTLVQTKQCKFQAVKALGKRYYKMEITDEQLEEYWGIPYRNFFANLFGHIENNLERVLTRYEALDDEFPMLVYPDFWDNFSYLCENYLLGIVTSAGRNLLYQQLAQLKIPTEKFSLLQASDDTEFHKPDSRVFEPTLKYFKELGYEASDITYVGDSLKDYYAARDAGFHFLGILRGTTSENTFNKEGAECIRTLAELKEKVSSN